MQQIEGTVDKVIYHNEDNGFSVFRVFVKHKNKAEKLYIISGQVGAINAGEDVKCFGIWKQEPKYGLQFKASFVEVSRPKTREAVEKYLSSGLIKGIGPYLAKKMVEKFGEKNIFDIIENRPEDLSQIEGIAAVRAENISRYWREHKSVREIIFFLHSHMVSISRAHKIYKIYGEKAIEIVTSNPYKLAYDIRGIGFLSADKIARNLGLAENSPMRIKASFEHLLFEATSEGHSYLPENILISRAVELLNLPEQNISHILDEELEKGSFSSKSVKSHNNDHIIIFRRDIFLNSYYFYEKRVAQMLTSMHKNLAIFTEEKVTSLIYDMENKFSIKLAKEQKIAVIKSLINKFSVITGGPGTGKTTIINFIVAILKMHHYKVKICAPTGKAAKRLTETTKHQAFTIHRLLGLKEEETKSSNQIIDCDYLILDEASMVDVKLFFTLVKAIEGRASLILVGDVDQLPSVGAGEVLKNIIEAEYFTVIKLTEIFRQANNSQIIKNAHRINNGLMPYFKNDIAGDFFFINSKDKEDIVKKIIDIVKLRLPSRFGYSWHDIQLLTPMQKGVLGARNLNIELQKALNPNLEKAISKYAQNFAQGDKVMQIVNNYEKEIYNGDMGFIDHIDFENQEIFVNFDNKIIKYNLHELDELLLSYAITIHKSQGSEYPVVILPITMEHFIILSRNLLYTAVTRAKNLFILIGEKKAIAIAIKNNHHSERYSHLITWFLELVSV